MNAITLIDILGVLNVNSLNIEEIALCCRRASVSYWIPR